MRQVDWLLSLPSGGSLSLCGQAASPPLLFLHGVGGAAWSWRPQVRAFAADYACYVWEARGHGNASHVADAGLADYATDAREGLAVAVERSASAVTLVGHSMGGLLAIRLAADFPQLVNGLVLIDPVYADGDGISGHDLGFMTPLVLGMMKPIVASFLRDGLVARTISRWIFCRSFTDRARMEAAWIDQRRQVPIEYPKMFFEAFGAPLGFPMRAFARELRVPVLLFNSRSTALDAALTQSVGARFFNERIVGGHYLQLDRPDAVNERMRTFLGEQLCT